MLAKLMLMVLKVELEDVDDDDDDDEMDEHDADEQYVHASLRHLPHCFTDEGMVGCDHGMTLKAVRMPVAMCVAR